VSDPAVIRRLRSIKRRREALVDKQDALARDTTAAVREAMRDGLSGPAIAAAVGLSHQRVYQLAEGRHVVNEKRRA